ncbi:MAG: hypothetical protein KJN76_00735 [Eudoraea sp.]|nr:hypothetical protein [Eudoraea sp.]
MAFEEFKDNLSEVEKSARSYIDSTREYYRLSSFKFLMQGIVSLSKILLIGTAGILALLFISFSASYGIGQMLDNISYGFLSVGAIYILIGIILYIFRRRIDKPLLRKFSEFYFDD